MRNQEHIGNVGKRVPWQEIEENDESNERPIRGKKTKHRKTESEETNDEKKAR